MSRRRVAVHTLTIVALLAASTRLSLGAAFAGPAAVNRQDLKEWLTYIASDDLEGRAVFTTGFGLAAAYIEEHLRAWGVQPAGDPGSYLQTVRVLGVKTTSHSTVTVEVGGTARTFAAGDGIVLQKNEGGRRRFTLDRVEFAGYGLDAPVAHHVDYRGKNVRGAAVVWLGAKGPQGVDSSQRRLLRGRNRYATETMGAAASIGPELPPAGGRGRAGTAGAAGASATAGGGRGEAALPAADFTTVQRLDAALPPSVVASDAFFEFLFSRAPTPYAELKRKAAAREPLPAFRLDGVTITFNIDADYQIVRTQLTQNVIAIVDGSDPQLKNTFVAFGAHYDHVGYAEGELVTDASGAHRIGAPGRVTPGAEQDRIWNGADDDGSGTVALMAIAHAFAEGPRPKRSLLFVWHAGEERGLYGSKYFADYPTVPIDSIVAQLNIDMIGRNRDNKASESNTVYLIGSDRISSELDAVNREANGSLTPPLTLDYEMNDPGDPEQLYTRSDHYSYASKGIPIIFFTTGLHPDYHANTDEVSKIEFDKLTRITQLVYETGMRVGNLDHPPMRDNKGPRAGKGTP
ncbi:MAG TPA: M28 family peptidase [Vicinamibacterales bacterium]|nr:M28 family peptidase [Vicinamibacterales bacterium]